MKTINTFSELKSKGTKTGETVIYNNEEYIFNGFSAYGCDHTLSNALRKIPKTEGKDYLLDTKYVNDSIEGYLIIDKKNKNGNYHVTPYNKKGKKGSGFSILAQEIGHNEIYVGGKTYKKVN